MSKIKINGVGNYAPSLVISNQDLEKVLDTSDEWIVQRTGIVNRHISEGENTSDLAYKAALKAIENSDITVDEIDAIIVATFTPDMASPSVASMVQKKLGNQLATCFDLNGACSGFVYAMKVASALILSSMHKNILIVGSEVISKVNNWEDRSSAILFGDGAGAMVLSSSDTNKLLAFDTNSKPDEDESVLYVNTLGLDSPYLNTCVGSRGIVMNGQKVFKFAVRVLKQTIENLLLENNLTIDDIDYIIPHQANKRIIESVANSLNVSLDKFLINVEEYGNTSSASIPMMFSEAVYDSRIKRGNKIIMIGFGAGLTWGGCLIEY